MNTPSQNQKTADYDCVVVGGGPAGSTAATELANAGRRVLLLERGSRIKPCGGAIPPRAIKDFDIPNSQIKAKIDHAHIIAPSNKRVHMPIDGGYVGMVDRAEFDPWLRKRAADSGAELVIGRFKKLSRDATGIALIEYEIADDENSSHRTVVVSTQTIIGADGANSAIAKQEIPNAEKIPFVAAYHEIVEAPVNQRDGFHPTRCDVYYQGKISPDFYGWVFPHGDTMSIGVGSAVKGFSLRAAVAELRDLAGVSDGEIVRREGAPLPLKPLKKWDNNRDVVLAGDAAGIVAPSSGEGIYYAMLAGRLTGQAVDQLLASGKSKCLAQARKRFMQEHGRVFWVLGIMQKFWYTTDKRRERFVSMCRDPDVQRLTWEAYMHKKLVRAKPGAHIKIFFKDVRHLLGLGTP